MRIHVLPVLLATTILSGSAWAGDLVLKRAVLGTGGVGYFEYSAEVTGAETLALRARLDQVDDILKSLIILDPAGTGSATLPGKAGADEAFAALPFGKSDLDSLPALIGAMKGAEIRLAGPRKLEGRIASVQTETIAVKDGASSTRTRVTVLAGASLEQFILEEAEGLTFVDARLGEQVDTALKALRAAQDRSGRDIAIKLAEGGKRTVRIGYVAEAPVWKAAYRLSLPKQGEDKAHLEGWVVLENMTGNPWKDVAITLSSAAPVTFRQALYDPYYVTRPQIAPPVSRAALPRTDQGQNLLNQATTYGANATDEEKADLPVAPAPPAPRLAYRRSKNGSAAYNTQFGGLVAGDPPAAAEESTAEENTAGASFTLSLPVSVGSGESLTIPFIDLTLPSDAVAWYQTGLARNPWHALTLHNDGQTSLPAGSATLYEGAEAGPLFSGEAQFPLLPAGDSRLIGFGTDQKVLIDHEQRSATVVSKIKVVKGMLDIESRERDTTIYRVKNGAPELRHMVIERTRIEGWTLVAPPPAEAALASGAYRMRFDVAAGQSKTFEVTLERPLVEEVAVGDVTGERISALMASDGLDAATKARLAKVAEAAASSDEAEAGATRLEEQRKDITDDQDRLRENLRSAPSGSDLARLYSQKMLAQEKSLDDLDAALKAARAKRDAARKALEDQVLAL
jgi:hypothetical protein